jgi:hypothetical protein
MRNAMATVLGVRRVVFRRHRRFGAYPVVDCTGAACGLVEDIELEAVGGTRLQASAVLIRADVRRPLWAQRLARLFTRGHIVRISWSDVRFADGHVALAKPASHYGIGASSSRAGIARSTRRGH